MTKIGKNRPNRQNRAVNPKKSSITPTHTHTRCPTAVELRDDTRQLLAVAFWVAHTPDNTPEAPIYVRGMHSVASPASSATAHFTNGDAVLIEFDAGAQFGPRFEVRFA
jgi:hypothetical protein